MPKPRDRIKHRAYANAWYRRNKKTVLKNLREKRAAETPEKKADRANYGRRWWSANSARMSDHRQRMAEIEKRLTQGVTRQMEDDGLTIVRLDTGETWWSGPGAARERRLEQIADGLLRAAERRGHRGHQHARCPQFHWTPRPQGGITTQMQGHQKARPTISSVQSLA
jgi:hypothetical protein